MIFVLNIAIDPVLIFLTKKKINLIKDSKINNSYCVISLYMLYTMMVGLGCTIIMSIVNLVLICIAIYPSSNYGKSQQ